MITRFGQIKTGATLHHYNAMQNETEELLWRKEATYPFFEKCVFLGGRFCKASKFSSGDFE